MHTAKIKEDFKDPNDIISQLSPENRQDFGYYLLRTNYKKVKPHSKYTLEGARPRSPNVPYSFYRNELIENNAKNSSSVFQKSFDDRQVNSAGSKNRFYVDRYGESVSQHLIRGQRLSQGFCFIRSNSYCNEPPKDYDTNLYGAYPTWGTNRAGERTKSHDLGEPVERFTNIDLYRRPLTNQAGRIIFDYGRANNGYYLQRNHYNNTWFPSKIELNKKSIIESKIL